MNTNLEKQLLNDFLIDSKNLNNNTNYFIVNHSDTGFLTYNNHKLAINILPNKILFRLDNKTLIDIFKSEYKDYPAACFFKFSNILKLKDIICNFDIAIIYM